jgi:hypothetical protein
MVYRKITLRRMPPVTRKYAKLLKELDSIVRRGKNLVEEIAQLELDSRALAHAKERDKTDEASLDPESLPEDK